jgi:hypothetical protein
MEEFEMKWTNKRITKANYYKTEHWKTRRAEALEDNEFEGCEICGSTKSLNVHHKNYFHLFNERDEDLMVVCRECHEELHNKVFDIEEDDGE